MSWLLVGTSSAIRPSGFTPACIRYRTGALALTVIRSRAFRSTFARMPSIGPLELAILLLIVLIIFGPKRLPGLGRQLGSGMREVKDSITGKDRDDDPDEAEPPAQPPTPAELDPTAAEPEVVTGEARREDQPASRTDS